MTKNRYLVKHVKALKQMRADGWEIDALLEVAFGPEWRNQIRAVEPDHSARVQLYREAMAEPARRSRP